jgi:hypothetical protein
MVLGRTLWILLVAAWLAGCGQSLFDSRGGSRDGGGGGDDGGGDADVPDSCPAPCLADAAADFDGTAGGKGNHWRYLDDNRNRTWTLMTAAAGAQVGVDARNSFKRCADDPSTAACKALPDALLVSTGGRGSRAEPAIELAAAEARVLRIAIRAHVPLGEHTIRLYRNSREDVLFTVPAAAGVTIEQQVTVDAVPGDRFLVAISADTDAGGAVALHVFVSDPKTSFPTTCQLAVPFSVMGSMVNTVDDLCRGDLRSFSNGSPAPPAFLAGPYAEQGMAAYLENAHYESTQPLTPGNAMTMQLWVRAEGSPVTDAWVLSNIDIDQGRGIALRLQTENPPKLQVSVVATTSPLEYASLDIPFGTPFDWHFVRVVQANNAVSVCVDGKKAGGGALAGPSISVDPMSIARSAGPPLSYFTGDVDDARVFFEALPCE